MNAPRYIRTLSVAALAGLGLLVATPAHAGDLSKVELTVGAKGGASGNVLLEPDNGPAGYSAPFEEGAGGWGGGGGIFLELRVLKGHLGVETGISVDYARNKSSITYNDTVETEWGFGVTSLRIPLLIQGGTSGRNRMPRFAFGIGPEFVIPVASKTIFEITEGEEFVPDPGLFSDGYTLRTKPQVGLAVNPGLGIPIGPLRLTIDIRYVVFFGVPKDYDDRVTADVSTALEPEFDVLAQNNMDLRLMLGLGYDFNFGKGKSGKSGK